MTRIYIGLVLYFAVNFGLSIWSGRSKAAKSAEGFGLGNLGYGPVLTAFAMGTTLASGFAFIGMVGMGYTMGIMATWLCIFGTILEFVCWYFLAKKCRQLSIETGSLTPTELVSRLHGDPGNWIKIIGGLFIGLFMVLYMAGQFNAGAVAAEAIGLDAFYVSVVVAILTMLFIFMGGVNAAMWTNAAQGIIMIVAFCVMLVIALSHVGGLCLVSSILSAR